MTSGMIAILGAVGDNFGAGMTGGEAFLYDPDEKLRLVANQDTIGWTDVTGPGETALLALLEEHVERTGSMLARELIADWRRARSNFRWVRPKEVLIAGSAPPSGKRRARVKA